MIVASPFEHIAAVPTGFLTAAINFINACRPAPQLVQTAVMALARRIAYDQNTAAALATRVYVEQSPFTIPEHLRGEIKRPDFLVGIPSIGTIAVDVKAKRIYRDALIIDAYEHRTLLAFETFFNTSVWFACFPPDEPHTCHLFLNRNLASLARSALKGEAVIAVPLKQTRPADEPRDFMAALMGAINLR